MKKLFTSIRQGKLDEVAAILDKNPELISCLAKAPPRKDAGQPPLMVDIKSDNPEVAQLLLDRGADVNFRDAPTQPHNESAPIWYNAIGQCFMLAGDSVSELHKERSKKFFLLLRRLAAVGSPVRKQSRVPKGALPPLDSPNSVHEHTAAELILKEQTPQNALAVKQYNIFDENRRKKETEILDELPELPKK